MTATWTHELDGLPDSDITVLGWLPDENRGHGLVWQVYHDGTEWRTAADAMPVAVSHWMPEPAGPEEDTL